MKKTSLIMAIIIGCSMAMTGCAVDGYVTDEPADVVYSRPVTPGEGYVWIDGDWVWASGTYHWHNGYWSRPREGRTWAPGHWEHSGRGYHWNRGHWR
ncbi:MAG TPA: hypothetical protein VGQ51_04445 [Puia sp.]|jgi:hypothetical protein|nr:hypothetical protein [Puia sp.]